MMSRKEVRSGNTEWVASEAEIIKMNAHHVALEKKKSLISFGWVYHAVSRHCSIPVQGSQDNITSGKLQKGFVFAHFSLHNSLSLSPSEHSRKSEF